MPGEGSQVAMMLRKFSGLLCVAVLAVGIVPVTAPLASVTGFSSVAHASEIAATVNKQVITSLDVNQRLAFLKLQRKKGANKSMALDEMIDDSLKTGEARRLGISIPDKEVDAAFANFAKQNKLTTAQLTDILGKAGVGAKHFKNYIRTQMAWGRAAGAKMRSASKMSEQDAVRKMLEKGGEKPSATEYMLQQVIFVVPAAKRGQIMGQRKKEATNFRSRFTSCEATKQSALGLKDVTVRDLGRILAPQLPPEWADMVKKTNQGQTTGIRETEKGVEFLAVCRTKQVSDDKAAAMVMQAEEMGEGGEAMAAKFLQELRDKANIVRR